MDHFQNLPGGSCEPPSFFGRCLDCQETSLIGEAAHLHSVCRRTFPGECSRRAFTLLEVLIVGLTLGILALVVIPQFSRASQKTNQDRLRDTLQYVRTQIAVFKAQHLDVPPGYPHGNPTAAPTADAFAAQMMKYSDVQFNLRDAALPAYPYGPYLRQLPVNAMNGLSTVQMIGNNESIPTPDGKTGWLYKPQTQEIVANIVGSDGSGTAYSNY
jgi:type II secretory pathway pseudopilin PulG